MLDCLWLHPKNGIRNRLNLNPFQFDYEIKPNTLNNVNWEKKERKTRRPHVWFKMILDSSEIVKLWHRLHVSERMLSYFKESFCRYHKTNSEHVKCIRQLIQLALVCLKNTWVLFFLHEIIPIFYVKTSNNLVFFYVIKGSSGIHLFIILLFKSTGRMMWILKNVYVQTHTHTFLLLPIARKAICWWIFFYRCCCHWLYVKLTVHFKFGHLSDPLDISVPCKNSVIFLFVNSTTKVYISEWFFLVNVFDYSVTFYV